MSPFFGHVDMITGFPCDYMHCVLEGVVKWLLKYWTDSKYHGKPFSICTHLPLLDEILLQQKPPHSFPRTPRSIKTQLSYWKASEYRYFLLFHSLPLLVDTLPSLYFHQYSLLVTAIHILLMDSITESQCNAAEEMLCDFYILLPELYGLDVHALTHLTYFVKQWGPLWTHSAFCFESVNGTLAGIIHSTHKVAEQLSFAIDA